MHGRYVVTEGIIQAIVHAATPVDGGLSPLETDFAANWPQEINFLPPPGQEPNPRPDHDETFLPDPAREDVFRNYTFIFCEGSQFAQLSPIVNGGGAKALLHEVPHPSEKPDVQDLIDYVQEVAGRKKSSTTFRLSQQPETSGIIVLRPGTEVAGGETYWQQFDLALDQRSMEQNEFLEAILLCDAKSLRRPLDVESVPAALLTNGSSRHDESRPPEIQAEEPVVHIAPQPESRPPSEQPQSQTQTKSRFRRHATKPRFADVDDFDDFDPSQIQRKPGVLSQAVPTAPPSQRPAVYRKQSSEVDQVSTHDQQSQGQKRPFSQVEPDLDPDDDPNEDLVDTLMTGAAALKKRRLEEQRNGTGPGLPRQTSPAHSPQTESKVEEPLPDVRKAIKDRQKASDALKEEDEEMDIRKAIQAMSMSEAQSLLQIDSEDLFRKDRPLRNRNPDQEGDHERWKAEWNGRPNYKRFRKAIPGQPRQAGSAQRDSQSQARRVIVETAAWEPGLAGADADEYWLERRPRDGRAIESQGFQRRRTAGQHTQSQSGSASLQAGRSQGRTRRTAGTDVASNHDMNTNGGSQTAADDNNDDDDESQTIVNDDENIPGDNDDLQDARAVLRHALQRTRADDTAQRDADAHISDVLAGRPRDAGLRSALASENSSSGPRSSTRTTTANRTMNAGGAANTRKRAASSSTPAAGGRPAKRVAASRRRDDDHERDDFDDDDDDDDDGTRFRRRRR